MMDKAAVQFVGDELGQHGPNVYFKEFSVYNNGEKRNYKLGEFYFVQKDPSQPICIAEFQLIWMNLKDGRKLAAVKLYFRPEDTKPGRLLEHGEDELMEADRHIPVYCEQVASWECRLAIPFGRSVYQGVPAGHDLITNGACSGLCCNCLCNTENGSKHIGTRTHVKVLSFPAYCRYRATMKLIHSGRSLPKKVMIARGAVEVDCCKTKILFNRFKFQHDDIENFALAENIRIPVFKGRPRKRRQSRTKVGNDVKKMKLEKDTLSRDGDVKIGGKKEDLKTENMIKEELKTEELNQEIIEESGNQTYRIVSPPANCNPERNVIHVKIENNSKASPDLYEIKDFEKDDMKIVIKANPCAEDNYIAEKENRVCWDDDNIEDGDIESPQLSGEESVTGNDDRLEKDVRRTRPSKGEGDKQDPPSELVKNGKTGTVLDEAFFREMRNGMKASEGVDKEKMKKILVDACKDVEVFKRDLFMFMKQRATPIVYVPKVGYTRVDLPKLFSLVVANGGYRQVTLNHKWKKVYDEMALATTITSAATCLRRHYEKLLLPFEKHLRVKHRQDALSCKTYSISAQASQPLVLTIKTIKNESDSHPTSTPLTIPTDKQLSLNHLTAKDGDATNCTHKPIKIFDRGRECKTNPDDIKDSVIPKQHDAWESTILAKTDSTSEDYPTSDQHPSLQSNHVTSPRMLNISSTSSSVLKTISSESSLTLTNCSSVSAIVSNPMAKGETLKMIEGETSINEKCVIVSMPAASPSQQHQSDYVLKKRRGRPPKNARPQIEVVTFDSSQSNAVFDQSVSKSYPESSLTLANTEGIHEMTTSRNSQVTITTASLGNSRMCTAEADRRHSKKGAVKVYEYVVNSDSPNAKMVKHQQGVISTFCDAKDNKAISSRPAVLQSAFGKESTVRQHSNVADLYQVSKLSSNIPPHYPRVETVMSFASKGCLPSTLLNAMNESTRISNISRVSSVSPLAGSFANRDQMMMYQDSSQAYGMHSRASDRKEIEIRGEREISEKKRFERRSIIVGPPPLVPIDKNKERNFNQQGQPALNSVVKKACSDELEQKHDSQQDKPNQVKTDRMEHISLASDIKAMKERFNVDSIIRPLAKTIDQSLASLRKVAVNDFEKEQDSKFMNGKHDVPVIERLEKEGEANSRCAIPLRGLVPENVTSIGHSELRVEVDRSLVYCGTEFKQHYNVYQKQKREEYDYQDANSKDSNQRLLRIASQGDFEAYSKDATKQKYTAQNGSFDEDLRAMKRECSNDSCGQQLVNNHGRPDFEGFDSSNSAIGKYEYNLIHPYKQDMVYFTEKCVSPLISHRPVYFEEHGSHVHTRSSQKLFREKTQEKYVLHRDEPHQEGESYRDIRCHRKCCQNKHTPHQRDTHHYGNSHLMRKFIQDHSSYQLPLPFYRENPCSSERAFEKDPADSNALYFASPHRDHYTRKRQVSPYHTGSSHSEFSRSDMIERSPPSSIRNVWYNAHHLPAPGKEGHGSLNNAMYWHQKVHH